MVMVRAFKKNPQTNKNIQHIIHEGLPLEGFQLTIDGELKSDRMRTLFGFENRNIPTLYGLVDVVLYIDGVRIYDTDWSLLKNMNNLLYGRIESYVEENEYRESVFVSTRDLDTINAEYIELKLRLDKYRFQTSFRNVVIIGNKLLNR